jgi:hypothetical protein
VTRRSFLPIPHEAFEVCVSNDDFAAVSRIYRDAHLRRWRPIRVSLRQFEDSFGIPKTVIHRLLRALEAAGLCTYAASKTGSTLTVFDGARLAASHRTPVEDDEDDQRADVDLEDHAGHPGGTPWRDTLAGHDNAPRSTANRVPPDTLAGHPGGTPWRDTSRARSEYTARAETETNTETETETDQTQTPPTPTRPSAPAPAAPSLPSPFVPTAAFFAVFPNRDAWKPVDASTLVTAKARGNWPFLSASVERMIAAGLMEARDGTHVLTPHGEALADALATGGPVWTRGAVSPAEPAAAPEVVTQPEPLTLAAAEPAPVLPSLPLPSAPPTPPAPQPEPADASGAPPWATKERRPKGVSPLDLSATVCRIADDITGTTAPMHRRGTAAKPILALWRALDRPPLADFERDVRLVAEAARLCPEPLFARDIRAEGWTGGTDRQRDVSTLCVQARWDERLRVATSWAEQGRTREKPKAATVAPVGRPTIAQSFAERMAAVRAKLEADGTVTSPPNTQAAPPLSPNTIDATFTTLEP